MAEVKDLSNTDASNTARFPESQAPSTVNNGARALEGMLSRALKDTVDGWIITGGTGSAYTATPNRSFTASATMYDGAEFSLQFAAASANSATLNVGTTDARLIFRQDGTTISASDILAGSRARVKYNTSLSGWILLGEPTPAKTVITATTVKQGLHTIWVPASAMVARTTNGAASGTAESTTNKVMSKSLDFDTTTQEFAQFSVRFPKSWDEGTITFAPVWSAASGSGGVVWALQGVALSDDDALDTAYGTEQTSTDTLITASDVHVGPTSSAITIAGTPAVGDWVSLQIKRNVSDGSDTLGVDARLLGVVVFFTINAADDT